MSEFTPFDKIIKELVGVYSELLKATGDSEACGWLRELRSKGSLVQYSHLEGNEVVADARLVELLQRGYVILERLFPVPTVPCEMTFGDDERGKSHD